jgi:hypothetical protein
VQLKQKSPFNFNDLEELISGGPATSVIKRENMMQPTEKMTVKEMVDELYWKEKKYVKYLRDDYVG